MATQPVMVRQRQYWLWEKVTVFDALVTEYQKTDSGIGFKIKPDGEQKISYEFLPWMWVKRALRAREVGK
jgi:hypothetical protein